ncbi:MAG: hypothetical protein R3Y35_04855 [Clostridia bacterium]
MKIFILLLLSFLSVIGAVELLRKFMFWLKKPYRASLYMGAVIRDIDEAEITVSSLIERIRWMELDTAVRLILIDKSNDPRVKQVVEKIIIKFPNVTLL